MAKWRVRYRLYRSCGFSTWRAMWRVLVRGVVS